MSDDDVKQNEMWYGGFDPGIDNAGIAFYDPSTKQASLHLVNLRLTESPQGELRNAKDCEALMINSVHKLCDMFDAMLAQTCVMAIEYPQMKRCFNVQALAFKFVLERRYPKIRVELISAVRRTRFFKSMAATYSKRKTKSWAVFKRLVSKDEYNLCRKTFSRRTSKKSKSVADSEIVSVDLKRKIVVVIKVDPVEAFLYAFIAVYERKPLAKINFFREPPVDKTVVRNARVQLLGDVFHN